MKLINRRTVLRGLGGVAIPLPLLDIMARSKLARAEGPLSKTGPNGAPKRFIMFFTPCGQGADWLRCKNDAQENWFSQRPCSRWRVTQRVC